jgi:ABC-type transport system involved in multi-copper enzyme maturation permease subunit
MYFWKYWRDTRRGFYVYIGVLAWLMLFWLYGLYRANRIHNIGGDPLILWTMNVGITFSLTYLCAIVMGFITATSNVGSDLAKGTAEFLLTRPRPRRYFVWAGWVAGLAEVFALMLITGALTMATTAIITGPVWRQVASPIRFQVDQQILNLPKMMTAAAIMAAVVFGLTYFLGVLFKSSQRGLIASLGICIGYEGLSAILKVWTDLSLPTMDFVDRASSAGAWHAAPQLAMTGWALLALAFPFAAQAALERTDI